MDDAGLSGGKELFTEHFSDEILSAFLDGELDPGRTAETRDHIRNCADCRKAADELTAIRQAAGMLEAYEPAAETWFTIRGRVAVSRARFSGWVWAGAAAAAAMLLVVAFAGRFGLIPGRLPGFQARADQIPEAAAGVLSPSREAADAGLSAQYQVYLAGVDAALSEIELALAENPGNPRVRQAEKGLRAARARSFDRVVVGGH